ncbi:hypothetical protein BC937DRAFT_87602 [Endogone sp. FLAS-F59071]|nr:hypothetical protein BC937DRAFT_87602 [Endogone sp. FLAS-F59071]|eukprot:RUS22720.1 hypothetical protein BC937DRAFT_87602 [Endogone sp. FLAS-F59071]
MDRSKAGPRLFPCVDCTSRIQVCPCGRADESNRDRLIDHGRSKAKASRTVGGHGHGRDPDGKSRRRKVVVVGVETGEDGEWESRNGCREADNCRKSQPWRNSSDCIVPISVPVPVPIPIPVPVSQLSISISHIPFSSFGGVPPSIIFAKSPFSLTISVPISVTIPRSLPRNRGLALPEDDEDVGLREEEEGIEEPPTDDFDEEGAPPPPPLPVLSELLPAGLSIPVSLSSLLVLFSLEMLVLGLMLSFVPVGVVGRSLGLKRSPPLPGLNRSADLRDGNPISTGVSSVPARRMEIVPDFGSREIIIGGGLLRRSLWDEEGERSSVEGERGERGDRGCRPPALGGLDERWTGSSRW